ncbi:MAG: phage terminase large subunit [Lachnospiraceae bacterium]|nr:phage terminase large subunit [Lachnospiraceae bacterium]MCM1240986.1 phage terminase large subunit [Lachnospiraceae bacterium]
MRKGKNGSIRELLGAMTEAESRIFYDGKDDALNDLESLLKTFLYKDDLPERVRIRKDHEAGFPATGKGGIRQRLGALDLEFFGRAYFPHYFSRPSPEFHRELDDIWQKGVLKGEIPDTQAQAGKISRMPGVKRVVAAPRGHAKSTSLTFKGTIHSMVYGYKHYPVIISDSSDQAEGFLENIRVELEENEALREDFGNLVGKVWRSNVLVTSTNIKVEAIGSGKKIRGRKHRNWRPDLLVLDDIENDENVRTPEQRAKLESWFLKAVSKAGDDYTDIIYIGTLLHYDSLLAKTLKNPGYRAIKYRAVISFSKEDGLWKAWEDIFTDLSNDAHEQDARAFFEKNKARMLEGTEVLWEEKLSYYDLMVMRVTDGEASFNSEEQNEPINPDDCMFNPEWFEYYNEAEVDLRSRDYLFFGFVDPSLGKTKHSDFSAIITMARHKVTGYMYVMDADIERRHPDKIIEDVLEKERWLRRDFGRGYKKFGAETVQFQWFLKEELAKASARAGLYLPIEEVPQTSDKAMRIQTMQPDIKNHYIKFSRRHKRLMEQLEHFPMGAHDDGPDALEGCRTLAKKTRKFRILDKKSIGL